MIDRDRFQAVALLAVLLGLHFGSGRADAQALWKRLIPGQGVEADAGKEYRLTEDHGPWMILATTFSGEGAEDQARELVLELRRRYKLEAYTHSKTFDFTGGVEGRGVDRTGRPLRMRYRRDVRIQEIAVLIGNYPNVDDPHLQRDLKRIKYLRPKTLDLSERETTNQSLAAFRMLQRMWLPEDHEHLDKGPMRTAFVTRNPLLPKEFFVPSGIDPFVRKMNEHVKFSLLDCEGKYTVKVATFTGKVVLDQQKVKEYESGKPLGSELAEAAEKAERLTFALRQKGYEAYSFHDRSASIVTVGSFDSIGTPRLDGKIEINPDIHKIMRTFGAERRGPGEQLPNIPGAETSYKLKTLVGIPLDIQPQIVKIPQSSLSSRIAGRRDY